MIPLRTKAIISPGGKLCFLDSDLLKGWLIQHAGQDCEAVFKKRSLPKTGPQLGYLFVHVIPAIAEYTGYTEEETYDVLKFKFLRVDIGTDKERVLGLSDTESDRAVTSKFIDDCVRFGLNLGAEIWPADTYGGTQ